jgi:ureidoglycolate hydrolase
VVVTHTLPLLEVTPEAWEPFGRIPSDEGTEHDNADLEFLLDDGHANFIAHDNSEIRFSERGGALCELLNRHDTHTQTLMPVDVEAYVVVAPAAVDFSVPAHFETVRAFRLPPLAVVHLTRGTWHWGPYPLHAERVRLFNIQGRGYPNDNGIAWLTRDHDVVYEVVRSEA